MLKKLNKLNPLKFLKRSKKSKKKTLEFYNIHNFCRGWFIGKFEPSIIKCNFEVAYHTYNEDEECPMHFHMWSDEINLVINGAAQIEDSQGKYIMRQGEIFVVPRGHAIKFTSIKDKTALIVIKTRSVKGDKYYV